MQVVVCVEFQRVFEENSSSHQEMMQPVRNAENYPTCEVTATSMSSNTCEGLLLFMIKESFIQKKRKKNVASKKKIFQFC